MFRKKGPFEKEMKAIFQPLIFGVIVSLLGSNNYDDNDSNLHHIMHTRDLTNKNMIKSKDHMTQTQIPHLTPNQIQ